MVFKLEHASESRRAPSNMNARPYFKSFWFGVNLLHTKFILRLFSPACVFCMAVTSMRTGAGSTLLAISLPELAQYLANQRPPTRSGRRKKERVGSLQLQGWSQYASVKGLTISSFLNSLEWDSLFLQDSVKGKGKRSCHSSSLC